MESQTDRNLRRALHNSLPEIKNIFHHLKDWWRMQSFSYNNYLREEGWVRSQREGLPVNRDGEPIPWYTYPLTEFLASRLNDEMIVFEYGSGYSTAWYANRVETAIGVEHDQNWVSRVESHLPNNGKIVYRNEKRAYIREIKEHPTPDIIVIDGEYRDECAAAAVDILDQSGVVILDDYNFIDKKWYEFNEEDFAPLTSSKSPFRMIPFYGAKPLANGKRCSALFYQKQNCLGL